MFTKKITKQVSVGNVKIGGNAQISVQTMLNSKTTDVDACVNDILQLKNIGCDLIRLAVPDEESAAAFGRIVKITGEPLIADVHYSYKIAKLAVLNGAAKLRMNPGNMSTDKSAIEDLVAVLKDYDVPVRVGVNGGSLDKRFEGMKTADALAASALDCAEIFEKCGFSKLVIAAKSSNVEDFIEANRKISASSEYPLHLGVTEAGTLRSGLIKSSVGIGTLLREGIGDTIRVSLSAPPFEEVTAGKTLLKTLGLRSGGVEVVSCPTCARTEIDVEGLASRVEQLTADVTKPLKISVMGCPLNGIGEGRHSDLGIAGGKEKSVLMYHGEIYKTVNSADLLLEFMDLLDKVLQE